jgi:hypothetical protein
MKRYLRDHEIDWNVWSLRYLFIFLHKTDDQICSFLYTYSELWVVEPSIIGIILDIFLFPIFSFSWLSIYRVRTTCSVSGPFSIDGVLGPVRWEDLAKIHFVEMCKEIIRFHPPVTIILENVVELFFKTFMIIPSFIFICEFTCPLSATPRVSDSDKLKSINLFDLKDTISVIEKNTGVTTTFFFVAIFVFYGVGTTDQESLRVIFLKLLPELTTFNRLCNLWSSEMELL